MKHIITVHHGDQMARHGIKGCIACCRMATVGLVDDADAFIALGPTVAHVAAVIGAAVVNHEDFELAVGLVHNAVEALVEIFRHVIDGHNNRYERLAVHVTLLSTQSRLWCP